MIFCSLHPRSMTSPLICMVLLGSTSKGLCGKMKSNSFGEVESSGGVTGNVKRGCKTAKSGRYQNEV